MRLHLYLLRLYVWFQGYRLARRNNYGMRAAYRFGKLAIYEHPSSRRTI